jgi:hypothetical protein
VKTIRTQNVSLPAELHEWVLKKMEETKLSTPWAKVTFSNIVMHALIELRNKEQQGKAATPEPAGVKMATLSESLGSGPLTATKKPSRRAG